MAPNQSARRPLLGLILIFLLAAVVTYVVFAAFVAGPDRGTTFYVALSLVISAEFVFFAFLAHSKLVHAGVVTAGAATRHQVLALIFVWFVLSAIAGGIISHPENADSIFSDRVLAIHLVLTFLFFAAAYFMYTKDVEVGRVDAALVKERSKIQRIVPDIEDVMEAVTNLGRRQSEHAVQADRVRKKLDTIRTGLELALFSERSVTEGTGIGHDWNAQIEEQIERLMRSSEQAAKATSETATEVLQGIADQTDAVLKTLKLRERSLTQRG